MSVQAQDAVIDFYEEAKTIFKLSHKNIVKCLGLSREPHELPCLIFEFMECGSLEDVLAANRTKNFQNRKVLELSNVSCQSDKKMYIQIQPEKTA